MASVAVYLAAKAVGVPSFTFHVVGGVHGNVKRETWNVAVGAVRLLYYIAVPYAALLYGSADLRSLGLLGGDPFLSVGLGVIVGGGAWVLLVVAWRQRIHGSGENPLAPEVVAVIRPWGWAGLLREATYQQVHWAFYRSWLILATGGYYGVFLGFLLAALEWSAGVILAHRWSLPGEWERALTLGGIAWVTAVLFLATGNLWLCLAVHVGLYWGLLRLMRLFA